MKLKVLYEDDEVIVMKAPHEEELEELVIDTIREKKKPLHWRELREIFSGIAGEDRLRKALFNLVEKGELIELPGNTYALPEMVTPRDLEEIAARKRRFYWYFGPRRRKKKPLPQSN